MRPVTISHEGWPWGHVPSGSTRQPWGQAASQPPPASQCIRVSNRAARGGMAPRPPLLRPGRRAGAGHGARTCRRPRSTLVAPVSSCCLLRVRVFCTNQSAGLRGATRRSSCGNVSRHSQPRKQAALPHRLHEGSTPGNSEDADEGALQSLPVRHSFPHGRTNAPAEGAYPSPGAL
jgi:hypothetical protein